MKSHVVLSKQVLLRFADNGSLSYLNVPDAKISRAYARTFDCHEGYFSEAVEMEYSKRYETTLGILDDVMQDFIEKKAAFNYKQRDLKRTVIHAIVLQMVRSRQFACQYVIDNSIIGPITSSVLYDHIFKDIDRVLARFEEKFQHHICNILVDKTSTGFVLPSLQYAEFSGYAILVNEPQYAFFLVPPIHQNKYFDENGPLYARISNIAKLDEVNRGIIRYDKIHGAGVIIGHKDLLKRYVQTSQ